MTPEQIRDRGAWPLGFLPLPHPNHPEGGMNFPQFHITRTELGDVSQGKLVTIDNFFELFDGILNPSRPSSLGAIKESLPYLNDGRLLTHDDTVEFFNLILEMRLTAPEKKDLRALLKDL